MTVGTTQRQEIVDDRDVATQLAGETDSPTRSAAHRCGALSLDTRLATYVPDYVPDDPRAADVTVRHVLSYTTGLPNSAQ